MTKKVVGNKNADYCVVSSGPDVCQVGNSLVPFDSFQQLGAEQTYVKTVRVNGVPTLTVGSVIKGTQGNAGSGIISGTSLGGGDCVITSGSPTVNFCGNAAAFHGSDVMMNNNNVPGILHTLEKVHNIAKTAATVEPRKEESIFAKLDKVNEDIYKRNTDIALSAYEHDIQEGFVREGINEIVISTSDMLLSGAANMAAFNAEQRAYSQFVFSSKEETQKRVEAAREIAKDENKITLPRLELKNDAQKLGASVYHVAELGAGAYGAVALAKTGIKALARGFRKTSAALKTAPVRTKPQNENTVSGKKEGSSAETSLCMSDPVDVATGDFIQVWPVLNLPGLLPVSLQRTYRSTAAISGLFGPKWADNWSTRIEVSHDNLIYHDTEGVKVTYPVTENTLNIRNVQYPQALLTGEINGDIRLFDNRTQLTQHFNHHDGNTRKLSAVTDRNGQRLDFRYDGKHRLILLARNGTELLSFSYRDGQLITVSLAGSPASPPLVTCRYDQQGYLSECDAFQQNHLWHEYNADGFMTRWHDTDQTDYFLEYDKYGRVTRGYSPSGYWAGRFIYDDAHRMTTYSDNEGGHFYYYYDDDGLVTLSIDPLGRETRTEWENGQKISETNAAGQTTRYCYHYDGTPAQVIFPDERSAEYQYNEQGQLTDIVTPFNDTWKIDYDPQGNLTGITSPQGNKIHYEYSQYGELLKAISPDGAHWQYQYNDAHQLIKQTDPYQNSTEFASDHFGRLTHLTDALNNTTRYHYDPSHAGVNGSISDIFLPDGVHQHIEYDGERRVTAVTDGEGKTTRYRYGPFDLLLAMVRPDGTEIRFEYDSLTRLKKVVNAAGDEYCYVRDKAGQIIRETDFTGREIQYRYDRLGRRTATRYPDQHEIRWSYSPEGLITRQDIWFDDGTHSELKSTTRYEYNERMQLIRAENPDAVTEFEYDTSGRLICEKINGREIQHDRDDISNRLTQTRFSGQTLQYQYGALGELTQFQAGKHQPLELSHNALGQEFLRRSQSGFASSRHYTATGMLAHQTAGRGSDSYLQALRDNPVQPPAASDVNRSWQYDKAYNITAIDDHRWRRMQYRYNQNDQIESTSFGGLYPQTEQFSYDTNLNIRQQTLIPGEAQGALHQLSQQQQAGRVVRRTTPTGHQEYHYDLNGRLERKTEHRNGFRPREWRYQWDTLNQLTSCFTPQGDCWRYTYDAFGRRLSKYQVVDMQSPVQSLPGLPPKIRGHQYLWSGNQMIEEAPVYADGTVAYDAGIQWLYEPGALVPAARYEKGRLHYLVTDHQGTPREIFTESGTVSWAARPDTWGQMAFWSLKTSANDPNYTECHFRFAGQYEDTETGLYYNRFRYYDKDTGQYISPDPIGLEGGFNPYGYVHNPVGWVDPFGLTCCPPLFSSRNDAFRAAKRDAGIPNSQRPDMVFNQKSQTMKEYDQVMLTDRKGNPILDSNKDPLWTREYYFTKSDNTKVIIQDHSAGHKFGEGGIGDQGAHFNVRPLENIRTGSVPGTFDHYSY